MYKYYSLWWDLRDSNPEPTGYEPVALTTELRSQKGEGEIMKTPSVTLCLLGSLVPSHGAPYGNRTHDTQIKSLVLYLLS